MGMNPGWDDGPSSGAGNEWEPGQEREANLGRQPFVEVLGIVWTPSSYARSPTANCLLVTTRSFDTTVVPLRRRMADTCIFSNQQEGTLSSWTKKVYSDLTGKLNSANAGCFFGKVAVNNLLYADDICHSVKALQKLIHVCEVFECIILVIDVACPQRGSHVSTYRCKLYHKYNLLGEDNDVIMIVLQFPHTPLIGGNFKSMTKVQLPCKLVVRRRPQTSEPAPRGALHAPRRFGSLCCYGNRPFGRPARAELYRLEPFERPAPGRRPKAFEPCRPGPVRDVVRASPSGQSGPFMAVRTVLRTVERPSRPTDPSDPRTIAWFELTVHAGSD
uniref:Uncharacterized protein n=1 Tax=Branchiostoma floridae TaxID=7739 RepID=C3YU64_BRAFL|eukprot:XP_002600329.1 hypothetical protein BRAFLDRAFT_66831 [Branchiostoma floridae]